MKDMIKRIREEKGGFTLAELLIVVAIILVLVAIAVPVFTANLNQAQNAVEQANVQTVKTAASVDILDTNKNLLQNADKKEYQGWTVVGTVVSGGETKITSITPSLTPITADANNNKVEKTESNGVTTYTVYTFINRTELTTP